MGGPFRGRCRGGEFHLGRHPIIDQVQVRLTVGEAPVTALPALCLLNPDRHTHAGIASFDLPPIVEVRAGSDGDGQG